MLLKFPRAKFLAKIQHQQNRLQRTEQLRHFVGDGPSRSNEEVVAFFVTSFHIKQL